MSVASGWDIVTGDRERDRRNVSILMENDADSHLRGKLIVRTIIRNCGYGMTAISFAGFLLQMSHGNPATIFNIQRFTTIINNVDVCIFLRRIIILSRTKGRS